MFDKKILRIIDAVNIPVLVADESGVIMAGNKSALNFFHSDNLAGTDITKFFPSAVFRENSKLLSLQDGETYYFFYIDAEVNGVVKETDLDVALYLSGGKRLYICTVKDVTIYSELLNSMDKFSTMVENSPAAVLIIGVDGNIEFISNNFPQLTGYSYEEMIGMNISMFETDEQKKLLKKAVMKAIKEEGKWKGELMNYSKSGDPYWAITTISPIYNKNREIANFIAVQEDITYLKKIEEELKQSQEKFRVLFETLPEGIVVTDLSGIIIQVNQAFLNIHGYKKRDDVVDRNIYDIAETRVSRLLDSLFNQAEKNGYSELISYEISNDDDDTAYIELQTALMTGEKGPVGFVLLEVDHTIRKKAEIALRESEARNRALIDAVPDIMFRVNDRGVYLDKMLGTKITEVFPDSIAVQAVRYISEAIKSREIQIFEYPVTCSGEQKFYESRFIAIEDDEVLIILRNVTERHTAMMQIEDSRREAELANRSKSEFLANMSHEIRTPLNSITGFIELLMRGRLDQDQREYLGIIKESASNLLELINDILDISKIESHKLELNKIEFNPYVEFESAIRLFSVRAGEKGMRFFCFIDPRIPEGVISDPLRIIQVLSNLLSNAIKFTPEDGVVTVEINLSRNADGFCLVNFSVSDTGIGIPARKQKQIFDAFTQADSSITRRFGGTGLGLSISDSLVRLLGSEIVLESAVGVGSKFYFTLELEVSDGSSPADFIRDSGIKTCVVTGNTDDYSFRNLEAYLAACSCDVTVCGDLSSAASAGCDVIFLVKPPLLPQRVSYDELKNLTRPVIAISEKCDIDCFTPDLRSMFSDVLYHPLTPDLLFKALAAAADLHGPDSIRSEEAGEQMNIKFSGRVLVGEDNIINQKLMMLLLKDYGIDVDIAGNGLAVFEKFKKNSYDLIMMDINMPAVDGLESAHMIREYEKENGAAPVPIVALTAKALKGDRDIISRSGMDGYLSKPVEMNKLEAVLTEFLTCVKCEKINDRTADDKAAETYSAYYDVKKTAAELRIPVNVLLNIGREFFDDALKTVEDIRGAAGLSSFESISAFSHKMRGASANLRFIKISDFFSELEEKSLQSEKNFDYSGILDNIISEISLLRKYF